MLNQVSQQPAGWASITGVAQTGCELIAAATEAAGLSCASSFQAAAEGILHGRALIGTTRIFRDGRKLHQVLVNPKGMNPALRVMNGVRFSADFVSHTAGLPLWLESTGAVALGSASDRLMGVFAVAGMVGACSKILVGALELVEIDRQLLEATPEERQLLLLRQKCATAMLVRGLISLILWLGTVLLVRHGFRLSPIPKASLRLVSSCLNAYDMFKKEQLKVAGQSILNNSAPQT